MKGNPRSSTTIFNSNVDPTWHRQQGFLHVDNKETLHSVLAYADEEPVCAGFKMVNDYIRSGVVHYVTRADLESPECVCPVQ